MKNKLFILILIVCNLLTAYVSGEVPPAKVVFQQYMNQAQTFANNFPREKAYLHFDNTSYYVGDTIWFKAYVTLAEQQTFSQISRPLYVELVDQTGHIADKQIIKLTQGEGNGQFILPPSMLSGYYEVRAYTRWMLAFNEPQYFSRTFPIYQLTNSDKLERSITTYELSSSMENRPSETEEKLNVRFFPEGGQLVEGISNYRERSIPKKGQKSLLSRLCTMEWGVLNIRLQLNLRLLKSIFKERNMNLPFHRHCLTGMF